MPSNADFEARLVPSTLVACATIIVYDWLCTLDQEISHVWTRPWSTGTLFFVFNRYLPFIDVFILLSTKFTRNSPEQCLTRNKIGGWLSIYGIFLSEVILMLRTYAFWERKRAVLISLAILCVCTVIPTAVFVQLELASLEYIPTDGVGCSLAKASSIIIYAYLMLMISETTIVVLTTIKACQALRHSRQPWIFQLYRDGMLFYVYLLGNYGKIPAMLTFDISFSNVHREHFGSYSRSLDFLQLTSDPAARSTLAPVHPSFASHTPAVRTDK
ncbi:hypothetical protein C8R44DRAFT_979277 [Mycena epipterygia]|nr:hypothetical protein C8R44DRAFT_979277 [Mycena epipterygia]